MGYGVACCAPGLVINVLKKGVQTSSRVRASFAWNEAVQGFSRVQGLPIFCQLTSVLLLRILLRCGGRCFLLQKDFFVKGLV